MKPLPKQLANEGDEFHPPSAYSQMDYYQQMIKTKFTLSPPGCTVKYFGSKRWGVNLICLKDLERTAIEHGRQSFLAPFPLSDTLELIACTMMLPFLSLVMSFKSTIEKGQSSTFFCGPCCIITLQMTGTPHSQRGRSFWTTFRRISAKSMLWHNTGLTGSTAGGRNKGEDTKLHCEMVNDNEPQDRAEGGKQRPLVNDVRAYDDVRLRLEEFGAVELHPIEVPNFNSRLVVYDLNHNVNCYWMCRV